MTNCKYRKKIQDLYEDEFIKGKNFHNVAEFLANELGYQPKDTEYKWGIFKPTFFDKVLQPQSMYKTLDEIREIWNPTNTLVGRKEYVKGKDIIISQTIFGNPTDLIRDNIHKGNIISNQILGLDDMLESKDNIENEYKDINTPNNILNSIFNELTSMLGLDQSIKTDGIGFYELSLDHLHYAIHISKSEEGPWHEKKFRNRISQDFNEYFGEK